MIVNKKYEGMNSLCCYNVKLCNHQSKSVMKGSGNGLSIRYMECRDWVGIVVGCVQVKLAVLRWDEMAGVAITVVTQGQPGLDTTTWPATLE